MIPALALLFVLATEAPNDYGATLPSRPPRAASTDGAVPGDTLTRVPGSPLRLGWTHERTSALGTFQEQGGTTDVTTRRGEVRWFGTTSQATLTYRADRLAAVRLECVKPTPALLSYVPDELRRAGYRRVSHEIASGNDRSEWSGPSRIILTASASSLVAEVSARSAPAAESVAALPGPAAAGTAAASAAGTMAGATSAGATSAGATSAGATSAGATSAGATSAGASTSGATPAVEPPAGALAGEIDFTTPRADSLPAPRVLATPPPPVRPRIAVDAGVFGRVQVRARVDTTGRVVHAEIARGISEFNSAALAWAADVRYEPYRVAGRLAPIVVLIPVVFARTEDGRPNP